MRVLAEIAWRDFMMWAIGNEEIRSQFEAQTGHRFPERPSSAIEAWVDEATGVHETTAYLFMVWASSMLWGAEFCPPTPLSTLEVGT